VNAVREFVIFGRVAEEALHNCDLIIRGSEYCRVRKRKRNSVVIIIGIVVVWIVVVIGRISGVGRNSSISTWQIGS
jgi:hypothetical protein